MDPNIAQAKRVVLKLGTQIVMDEGGTLALDRLRRHVEHCAQAQKQGREILIVTSGAVGLGRQALNKRGALTLPEKQACAAVGQNLLMNVYRELFGAHDLLTAQILLTAADLAHRQRYLNLRETLERLLQLNVVPIINENDTISTMELQEEGQSKSFGDNDKLSALVAGKLDADLLVILTNVDGIYTENPALNPNAERIPLIDSFERVNGIRMDGQSAYGRGGMSSKVEAVRIAAISGVHTLIASGLKENALACLSGDSEPDGTFVLPQSILSGRKRWIGLASGYNGVVVVNEGAKKALMERHASLLPSGVVQVLGTFQPRQVVSIQDEEGVELGRGLSNFGADDTRKIQGCQSHEISSILGPVENDVVIQRDNLVIFQEHLA